MRGIRTEESRSRADSKYGRAALALPLLAALLLIVAFTGSSSAAGIELHSPTSGATLHRSAFALDFDVQGLSEPYEVACLVNGRLPDSPFNCDPAGGHADLANGRHLIRLIAYELGGAHRVAVRAFGVTIDDRRPPRVIPQLHNGDVVHGDGPPFAFRTAGASFWRCRVDGGGGQPCGPDDGHKYDSWARGLFQPRSLAPGWHTISFTASDSNHRLRTVRRHVLAERGDGPDIAIQAPAEGSTIGDSPASVKFWVGDAVARVFCAVDGVRVRDCTGSDREYRYGEGQTAPLPLANGPHTVRLRAADAVGNIATAITHFTVDDSSAPDVAIDEPADGHVYDDISTWQLKVRHSAGVAECRLNSEPFEVCGGMTPTGAAWPDSAGWARAHPDANGDYSLDVRVTDPQGRQTTATTHFTIADFSPPDAYPIWPLLDTAPRVFALLFSDYGERWRCTLSVDGDPFAPCAHDDPHNAPDLVTAECGPHTYSIRLEDGVGNVQTITRHINVVSGNCPAADPPPGGPTGGPGDPTGATGPLTPSPVSDVPSIKLSRPGVRYSKHHRALLTLSGSIVGDCAGTTRLTMKLRGSKLVGGSPQLRDSSAGCTFAVTRRVSSWRIAGLRTKLRAAFTYSAGTVTAERGFRAPRH